MAGKRRIEIFSAGCPVCQSAVEQVREIACGSCDVNVLDMKDSDVAQRANLLDVTAVPAVAIDGKLAECCAGRGLDEKILRAAGLGQPIV
jgi:glutaredoxin 3